jgi:hypothetical protein
VLLDLCNVIGRGNSSNFGTATSWAVRETRKCAYAPRAFAARPLPVLLVAVRLVGT